VVKRKEDDEDRVLGFEKRKFINFHEWERDDSVQEFAKLVLSKFMARSTERMHRILQKAAFPKDDWD
jgi:hypothetical protein